MSVVSQVAPLFRRSLSNAITKPTTFTSSTVAAAKAVQSIQIQQTFPRSSVESGHFVTPVFSRRSLGNFGKRAYHTVESGGTELAVILHVDDVDPSRVKFSEEIPNKRGGKFVRVTYELPNGKVVPLRVQTPKCRLPFGLYSNKASESTNSEGKKDEKQGNIMSITVSLDNSDKDPVMGRFRQMFEQLDEAAVNHALPRARQWFPTVAAQAKTEEMLQQAVKMNFRPSIRQGNVSKSGQPLSPCVRWKIPMFQDKPALQVYHNTDVSTLDALTPGQRLTSIIELHMLWQAGIQYGLVWRVLQTRIEPSQGRFEPLLDYAIKDDGASKEDSKA